MVRAFLPSVCLKSETAVAQCSEEKGRSVTVKAMQKAMNAESQTALIGTSCLFTWCQRDENGIAPSLENAYAILTDRKHNSQ
jgi:hypothetical protein